MARSSVRQLPSVSTTFSPAAAAEGAVVPPVVVTGVADGAQAEVRTAAAAATNATDARIACMGLPLVIVVIAWLPRRPAPDAAAYTCERGGNKRYCFGLR
ncbi:hypothetical protein HerbRD11066_20360 [Herbidospora sp. RD11066]